jgi:STAS-like domain of unknown function (DUF4325)
VTVKKIKIEPVPGTGLAESKDDARSLREDEILPALSVNRSVELDFSRVEFATQSFMHALISDAIRRYGDGIFDLITFANCTDEVRQIVLTVFEYTIDASDASGGLQGD